MKVIKLNPAQRQEMQTIVSKFKRYSNFSSNKKAAFRYAEIFQICVCPYCNIHYIDTIANTTRPEFDHFIPKSSAEGKLLELDIDNLIPACHVCNSTIKRNKKFSITTHIHPLHDDFDSIISFCIDIKKSTYLNHDGIDIDFCTISTSNDLARKAYTSIDDLKLHARYQTHKKHVIEILKFIRHYNSNYRQHMYNMANPKTNTTSGMIELIEEFARCNINNTSLGKLRKDIVNTYTY